MKILIERKTKGNCDEFFTKKFQIHFHSLLLLFSNVFGSNGISALNIVEMFFGIRYQRLLKGNFARIILVALIIFCLIVRTIYLSFQYEIIAGGIRKQQTQTIQQLCDENFTFLIEENIKDQEMLENIIKSCKM